MNRPNRVTLLAIVVSITMILSSIFCSCNDAYRTATVTRDNIRFEFDYPSSFRDPYNTLGNSTIVVESIVLLRPHLNPDEEDDTILKINPYHKTIGPDIHTIIEDRLRAWNQLSEAQQFTILERSKIEVAGIPGEKIVYSIIYLLVGEVLDSHVSYVREVFIEYKGVFWNIQLITFPEMTEQTEIEFKRILDSFHFIN